MRICAFKNCHNGDYKLRKFRKNNPGQSDPFTLYPFPHKIKKQLLQWCVLINRIDEGGNLWMPNKQSRVCSIHFKEGQPTEQNPTPTLHLGYQRTKAYNVRRTKNSGFNETCEGSEQKTPSKESADLEQQNTSDSHPYSQTSSEVTELPETPTAQKKRSALSTDRRKSKIYMSEDESSHTPKKVNKTR
ncbi:hypothetical protein EB796_003092 [Bugula neritina]|uniref:THAP-type domain-containing protein n=1 Tax=Bugula neritina TaxID=10212 RepID=A0A7J7KIQ3_BUGNE|nr:hypothetical protein EB796_003092 [Bugula neritina]